MPICLSIGDDYLLQGTITHFEAYMFATADKHIREHTSFDEELVLVDGNRSNQIISMTNLNGRKLALAQFNNIAQRQIPSIPKPTDLSCCMVDFFDEKNIYDDMEIREAYAELKDMFLKWMRDNDRVAVMVQHFYQGTRVPHVHILYQRDKGKCSEFQTYCLENM